MPVTLQADIFQVVAMHMFSRLQRRLNPLLPRGSRLLRKVVATPRTRAGLAVTL